MNDTTPKEMKAIRLIVLCGLVAACGDSDGDREAAVQKKLSQKTIEVAEMNTEIGRLRAELLRMEGELEKAENRVRLAKESSALYEELLKDSNAAKLEKAREMLSEAMGMD